MRFCFDRWTLDADRRLLMRGSDPVSLSPKAFDLLKLLAEHHERAFSKIELHQHLWPNTFVSDGSLTILIAEIRQVLQDEADRPRFIRTVRRFGYGFCMPVVRRTYRRRPWRLEMRGSLGESKHRRCGRRNRSWVERSMPPSGFDVPGFLVVTRASASRAQLSRLKT